jgi:hypothetical protein
VTIGCGSKRGTHSNADLIQSLEGSVRQLRHLTVITWLETIRRFGRGLVQIRSTINLKLATTCQKKQGTRASQGALLHECRRKSQIPLWWDSGADTLEMKARAHGQKLIPERWSNLADLNLAIRGGSKGDSHLMPGLNQNAYLSFVSPHKGPPWA